MTDPVPKTDGDSPLLKAKPELRRILLPNEHIVRFATLHWMPLLSGIVIVAIGFGFLTFDYFLPNALYYLATKNVLSISADTIAAQPVRVFAYVVITAGLLQYLFQSIIHIKSYVVLTNERLIYRHGFLTTTLYQIQLAQLISVEVEQSRLGDILNYGDIVIQERLRYFPAIHSISAPQELSQAVMNLKQAL